MDEAERLCDRLVVLRDGLVVARGTPAELVAPARRRGHAPRSPADLPPTRRSPRCPGWRGCAGTAAGSRSPATRARCCTSVTLLVARGESPGDLVVRQATLEDAYIRLVGRAAGDAAGRRGTPGAGRERAACSGRRSRVELLLLLREPVTLVFALALPIVNVVVLGGVFGDQPDPTGRGLPRRRRLDLLHACLHRPGRGLGRADQRADAARRIPRARRAAPDAGLRPAGVGAARRAAGRGPGAGRRGRRRRRARLVPHQRPPAAGRRRRCGRSPSSWDRWR